MLEFSVFLPACMALNLAFGPSNLLAMMHGAKLGLTPALVAGLARLLIFVPMIVISALGFAALVSSSGYVFTVLRLLGAAYLIYLGFRLVRVPARPRIRPMEIDSLKLAAAIRNEALAAFSNPKAILIFAAFFPQFVDPSRYWESYAVVGCTFLVLESVAILAYATTGALISHLGPSKITLLQKASGISLIVFGLLLFTSRNVEKLLQ